MKAVWSHLPVHRGTACSAERALQQHLAVEIDSIKFNQVLTAPPSAHTLVRIGGRENGLRFEACRENAEDDAPREWIHGEEDVRWPLFLASWEHVLRHSRYEESLNTVRNQICNIALTGDEIVLRLDAKGATAALKKRGTRPMNFTGRVLKTMVYVEASEIETDRQLMAWVKLAISHVKSLPSKVKRN